MVRMQFPGDGNREPQLLRRREMRPEARERSKTCLCLLLWWRAARSQLPYGLSLATGKRPFRNAPSSGLLSSGRGCFSPQTTTTQVPSSGASHRSSEMVRIAARRSKHLDVPARFLGID